MIEKIRSTMELVAAQNLAYRHWVAQETVLPYQPYQYVIEPTAHCNMKCLKCPQAYGLGRKKGYMDMAIYRDIIDQIAGHAISLYFMFGGESMLHRELFDMVRLAKEKGIRRTFLATNGTLINPDIYDAIFQSGLDTFTVTFDGDNPETCEMLCHGAKFESVMENVIGLLKEKKRRGLDRPFISVKVVRILKEQPKEISAEFRDRFKNLPVNRIYSEVLTLQGKYAKNLLADNRFEGLLKEDILERDQNKYFPCLNLYSEMVIAWNGQVIGCCRDLEGINVLDDVREKPLAMIWNDEPFRNLRKKLIEGRYTGPCTLCSSLWMGKPTSPGVRNTMEYLTLPKYLIRDYYPNLAGVLLSGNLLNRIYIAKHSNTLLQDCIRKLKGHLSWLK